MSKILVCLLGIFVWSLHGQNFCSMAISEDGLSFYSDINDSSTEVPILIEGAPVAGGKAAAKSEGGNIYLSILETEIICLSWRLGGILDWLITDTFTINPPIDPTCLAYNDADGLMYGGGSSGEFYRINLQAGTTETLHTYSNGVFLDGCEFVNGTLYGGTNEGGVYIVDPDTGGFLYEVRSTNNECIFAVDSESETTIYWFFKDDMGRITKIVCYNEKTGEIIDEFSVVSDISPQGLVLLTDYECDCLQDPSTCTDTTPNGGGDPEYISLDKTKFKYDGPCQYLLSSNDKKYCNSDTLVSNFNKFSIITRHGRTGSRIKNIVTINKIIINLDDKFTIEINQNNQLVVNNESIKLNVNETYVDKNKNFRIFRKYFLNSKGSDYEENIQLTTKYGLNIRAILNNIGQVWITVPKTISTCGLLGNNNDIDYDDIILRNGTTLYTSSQDNIDVMGDSWMIPYKNQPLVCDLFPTTSYNSFMSCNYNRNDIESFCDKIISDKLNDMTGEDIEACFSDYEINSVDATRLYDNCITEICMCSNEEYHQCFPKDAMNLFESVCTQNGVKF